jgi:hypothetical protein
MILGVVRDISWTGFGQKQSLAQFICDKENLMPLELRKWFQVLTSVLGMVAAGVCWFFVRSAIEPRAHGAQLALVFLTFGALIGFGRILTIFLPLVLPKIWKRLDS